MPEITTSQMKNFSIKCITKSYQQSNFTLYAPKATSVSCNLSIKNNLSKFNNLQFNGIRSGA